MLEQTAKAVKSILEADSGGLPDKLDEVETYWSDEGDSLTLPDPQTYELGGNPDILEYERSSMPVVVCMAQSEGPSGEHEARGRTLADQSDQWGYGEANVLATVLWWVDDDDWADAVKIGWRYAEAIVKVLRDHERLDTGIRLVRYVPRIDVDPARRQLPDTGAAYYTVMGQMEFAVQARHT